MTKKFKTIDAQKCKRMLNRNLRVSETMVSNNGDQSIQKNVNEMSDFKNS